MDNDKLYKIFKIFAVILFIVQFITVIIFTTGCKTTRFEEPFSRNTYTAGRMEETAESLNRTVINSRERIGNIITASRQIEDGIERIEYLFAEYEREVERILEEIDTERRKLENSEKSGNGNLTDSVDTDTDSCPDNIS